MSSLSHSVISNRHQSQSVSQPAQHSCWKNKDGAELKKMDDGMGMPDTIALHSYYKEVDGKYLRIQRAASVFMPYVGPSPCSRDTAVPLAS